MTDTINFHKLALESSLFKGRANWYFCYLKSEKIAHALLVLESQNKDDLKDTVQKGVAVPTLVCQFAAGRLSREELLAEVFSLISSLKISGTKKALSPENTQILVKEYEQIVESLEAGEPLSSPISASDLIVPTLPEPKKRELSSIFSHIEEAPSQLPVKDTDTYKRHVAIKDTQKDTISQKDRGAAVLEIVKKNNGISIKNISALVKDCSEKTIQRELVSLIQQGLVRKVGERRWSLYFGA